MRLKELYKHRTDFTIIGLTGRTGSGCTQIADLLSNDFSNLKHGLRELDKFNDDIFKRKFEICDNYLSYQSNWQRYDVIKYKKVLLLYIFKNTGNKYFKIRKLLYSYYRENKLEDNNLLVNAKFNSLIVVLRKNNNLIEEINKLPKLEKIRSKANLLKLKRCPKIMCKTNIIKKLILIYQLFLNIKYKKSNQ